MARPKKNNADYFSHDNDARNHRKIKALRNKFGIAGYGFWFMLLEFLTYSDYNQFEFTDSEVELMAGDFGVSATEIHDMLSYCISLDMITLENGVIRSKSLDERLECVYKKRGAKKEFLSQKPHNKVVSDTDNTNKAIVSATESTQSKVKEIKVKEKKNIIGETIVSPDYKKFYDWLVVDAPRLLKMKEPFTETQYLKILLEFSKEEIYDTVLAMQNYEGLTKKVSANLTFRKWATNNRERNNKNIPTDNPNQLYQNGYPVDKNNPMTFI